MPDERKPAVVPPAATARSNGGSLAMTSSPVGSIVGSRSVDSAETLTANRTHKSSKG